MKKLILFCLISGFSSATFAKGLYSNGDFLCSVLSVENENLGITITEPLLEVLKTNPGEECWCVIKDKLWSLGRNKDDLCMSFCPKKCNA